MRPLGECCGQVTQTCNPAQVNGLTYLGLEHLASGFPALVGHGRADQVRSAKTLFRRGDLLFGKLRPYLQKAALAPFEGMCSTDIIVLRAGPDAVPEFLVDLFHTDGLIQQAIATTSGVNHPRTSWSRLAPFIVPVPPVREQRRIAALLSAVQRAIEQREKLIALTAELKKALIQKLFTEGTRGERLKETEIGLIPESWDVVTLEEVKASPRSIVSGPFGSNIGRRFFVQRGVPLVRGCNLTKGDKFLVEDGFVFITEEKAAELANCTALPGDLVFTAAGTLGQVGLIPDDCMYPKYVISNKQLRARINPQLISPKFLFYWFSSAVIQRFIEQRRSGASVPVINLGILRRLPIPLPQRSEQDEMVRILELIRQSVDLGEAIEVQLRSLLRTLLHQLMTAQLRVDQVDMSELEALGIEVD